MSAKGTGSMNSRFEGLKASAATAPVKAEPARLGWKNPREGKKAVVGYYSPAVSRALHQLAVDTDSNIQALIGEAIDDLMRKHCRHPFGER
jgi:Antitoxin-like ribbon-helix-helix